MRNQGVGSWIARRARIAPTSTALVHERHEWTYAEMHERVTRLAHALVRLGVGRSDRVAYLGPNHPAFLETLFAAGTLGAVFVPMNTRLAAPELAYNLSDSGSCVLVYAPEQADIVATLRDRAELRHLIALERPAPGEHSYAALLAQAPADPLDEPVALDETCMVMYTS